MVSNHHTLNESKHRDFGYDQGVYVNWYITGKAPSAWKRRASGRFKGQKYRVFTRSGKADQINTPIQDVKDSPAKFWVVWLMDDDTIDRIEWMNRSQLEAMGAKDTFEKGSHRDLDWWW
jgi:hypothetical protein